MIMESNDDRSIWALYDAAALVLLAFRTKDMSEEGRRIMARVYKHLLERAESMGQGAR